MNEIVYRQEREQPPYISLQYLDKLSFYDNEWKNNLVSKAFCKNRCGSHSNLPFGWLSYSVVGRG